jgi:hypothetical protein
MPTELSVTVAKRCRVASTSLAFPDVPVAPALRLLMRGNRRVFLLSASDWCAVVLCCKAFQCELQAQAFWLQFAGFQLPVVPDCFSPLKLYVILRAETQAAENSDWQRNLLTQDSATASIPLKGSLLKKLSKSPAHLWSSSTN